MKATWNGRLIAQSDATLVIEGNHYFPPETADPAYLIKSDTTTICPWKGTASYYSLQVDGQTNTDAAWTYKDPKPEAAHIKGYIAFWHGVTVSQ